MISGWNVADGYLPPTESTAFSRQGERNVYRTGDRAEIREGKLFIMGRVDKVVKVRGFRVDTDGVESLLMRAQGVRDVCVRKFGEGLYAVLVAKELEEVKAFAREHYEHARLIAAWRWWVLEGVLHQWSSRDTGFLVGKDLERLILQGLGASGVAHGPQSCEPVRWKRCP